MKKLRHCHPIYNAVFVPGIYRTDPVGWASVSPVMAVPKHVHLAERVSESRRRGSNSCPTRSPVVDKARMKSVGDFLWFGSVLWVPFSVLTLLLG